VPSQFNSADFISTEIAPTTLSTSTLWWKGPEWLSHETSSRTTTEIKTPTGNLEIRNVHIACIQLPEDITQIFSKLNTNITVIG